MIELIFQRRKGVLDVAEIHQPTGLRIHLAPHRDLYAKRMAMQARAFMIRRRFGQAVGSFKAKILPQFHVYYFRLLHAESLLQRRPLLQSAAGGIKTRMHGALVYGCQISVVAQVSR